MKSLIALTSAKACFSMILYFSYASLSTLLKKAISFSHPWSSFCNKIVTIVCSEANEKIMKSLSNWGIIRTGVLIKAILISSNASLDSTVHLILESFFMISLSNLISSTKLDMNLLQKIIFPKKACSSLILLE